MSYVIQASPLSKLYMREWISRCEENPELVFEPVPFKVIIPRSFGAIVMEHNKPMHTSKLFPKQAQRKQDEHMRDEIDALVQWLTGGPEGTRSEETDIYGVVSLDVDLDIGSQIVDIATLTEADTETGNKKAKKAYEDMQKVLLDRTKGAIERARELADARVRRAMKITHQNLIKQYETLRTEGKGVYSPSVAEAIGAHVLMAELEKASSKKRSMVEKFTKVMNETTVIG